MTRDKIIKGLIRGYSCDDEDDCSLSCNDCIHQKFSDYEKQIRADVIDEFDSICEEARNHKFGVCDADFVVDVIKAKVKEQLKG